MKESLLQAQEAGYSHGAQEIHNDGCVNDKIFWVVSRKTYGRVDEPLDRFLAATRFRQGAFIATSVTCWSGVAANQMDSGRITGERDCGHT